MEFKLALLYHVTSHEHNSLSVVTQIVVCTVSCFWSSYVMKWLGLQQVICIGQSAVAY